MPWTRMIAKQGTNENKARSGAIRRQGGPEACPHGSAEWTAPQLSARSAADAREHTVYDTSEASRAYRLVPLDDGVELRCAHSIEDVAGDLFGGRRAAPVRPSIIQG